MVFADTVKKNDILHPFGGDWNMTLIFQLVVNVIIPIDEVIFFRGIETTNQYRIDMDLYGYFMILMTYL